MFSGVLKLFKQSVTPSGKEWLHLQQEALQLKETTMRPRVDIDIAMNYISYYKGQRKQELATIYLQLSAARKMTE